MSRWGTFYGDGETPPAAKVVEAHTVGDLWGDGALFDRLSMVMNPHLYEVLELIAGALERAMAATLERSTSNGA